MTIGKNKVVLAKLLSHKVEFRTRSKNIKQNFKLFSFAKSTVWMKSSLMFKITLLILIHLTQFISHYNCFYF